MIMFMKKAQPPGSPPFQQQGRAMIAFCPAFRRPWISFIKMALLQNLFSRNT